MKKFVVIKFIGKNLYFSSAEEMPAGQMYVKDINAAEVFPEKRAKDILQSGEELVYVNIVPVSMPKAKKVTKKVAKKKVKK